MESSDRKGNRSDSKSWSMSGTCSGLCRSIDGAKRRRSFHSDEPSLHEIFKMREDRKGRRAGKRWVKALVNIGNDQGDRGVSGVEPGDDRFFAPAAMLDECVHKTLRLHYRAAMARPIN